MKENIAAPTGNSKRKQNGYNSTKLWAKRERKRNEALDRQEKYDGMTTLAKLKMVRTLGGSKRQLARLEAQYKKENAAPVAAPVVSVPVPPVEAPAKVKAVKKKKS